MMYLLYCSALAQAKANEARYLIGVNGSGSHSTDRVIWISLGEAMRGGHFPAWAVVLVLAIVAVLIVLLWPLGRLPWP